jgi:hypothetical protein
VRSSAAECRAAIKVLSSIMVIEFLLCKRWHLVFPLAVPDARRASGGLH